MQSLLLLKYQPQPSEPLMNSNFVSLNPNYNNFNPNYNYHNNNNNHNNKWKK